MLTKTSRAKQKTNYRKTPPMAFANDPGPAQLPSGGRTCNLLHADGRHLSRVGIRMDRSPTNAPRPWWNSPGEERPTTGAPERTLLVLSGHFSLSTAFSPDKNKFVFIRRDDFTLRTATPNISDCDSCRNSASRRVKDAGATSADEHQPPDFSGCTYQTTLKIRPSSGNSASSVR